MADQALGDLIAHVSAISKRLVDLDGRLDGLENTIGNLGEQLARQAEDLGTKGPAFMLSPWWWPTMAQSQAREAWETLTAFVDTLIIPRYDDGKNTVPMPGAEVLRPEAIALPTGLRVLKCWFAHPKIVDKLSALFWAQKGDYRRNAAASGPLEWQETWLPKTLDGLDAEFREHKCFGSCPYLSGEIAGDWPNQRHEALNLGHRLQWIEADISSRPV